MSRPLRRLLLAAGLLFAGRALLSRRRRRALLLALRARMPQAELSSSATEWTRDAAGIFRARECALGLDRTRLLIHSAEGGEAFERAAVKRAEFVYGLPGRGFPAGLLSLRFAGGDRHFRLPGDAHPWLDLLNRR